MESFLIMYICTCAQHTHIHVHTQRKSEREKDVIDYMTHTLVYIIHHSIVTLVPYLALRCTMGRAYSTKSSIKTGHAPETEIRYRYNII